MLKTFLAENRLSFHPSPCLNVSIISKNHWPQFIRKNYFQFQTGFQSYVDLKFNLTLTRQLINKLRL